MAHTHGIFYWKLATLSRSWAEGKGKSSPLSAASAARDLRDGCAWIMDSDLVQLEIPVKCSLSMGAGPSDLFSAITLDGESRVSWSWRMSSGQVWPFPTTSVGGDSLIPCGGISPRIDKVPARVPPHSPVQYRSISTESPPLDEGLEQHRVTS